MNKKGDLVLSETVRIVLAVASILLLFYLAFSLYGIFTSKTEIQQAREHLEQIELLIGDLEEQGGGSEDYVLLTPNKWILVGWPSDGRYSKTLDKSGPDGKAQPVQGSEEDMPTFCSSKNWEQCICFCGGDGGKNILDRCNELNFCFETNFEELVVGKTSVDGKGTRLGVGQLREANSPLAITLEDNKLTLGIKNE